MEIHAHLDVSSVNRTRTGEWVFFFAIIRSSTDLTFPRFQALGLSTAVLAVLPIVVSLRNEAWGDRHFSIVDPNGIGIDTVTRIVPA